MDGLEIFRIKPVFSSYYWTRLPLVGRQARFIRDMIYAWQVRQTLLKMSNEFRPDIVEYADIDAEGIFHPKWLCPYVVKLHTPHILLKDYYSNKEVPYARTGIEWLEAKAIHRAAGISSPSVFLAREIVKRMNVAVRRIQYVPNFIDTNLFSPSSADIKEQPLSVLYVGRLEPLKGATVFAQAIPLIARSVPIGKFIFLGRDRAAKNGKSQQGELRDYFEQEGLLDRVEFHGHASPEVFRSFYQRASVFVMPSLFENSPYTLLEAMACGKASVVSRSGGMPEMIRDGESGILFEPGNPNDLAEKVVGLLRNPERREAMGRAARQHVAQAYNLEVGAKNTAAFYQSVLKNVE